MSNKNAKIEYESGVTPFLMGALTDSGDRTLFTSEADLFSATEGNAPDVRPDGILTGGDVIPAVSGTNDLVDVAALTCYLAGVLTSVAADTDVAITRPATAVSKVNSITVNSSGAVAVVAGTDGGTTAFSETRGAAGGPPYIPVGSIELAQVRVASDTAAAITAAQIFKVVGTHREMSTWPNHVINYSRGTVTFNSPLSASHTGDLAKGVYASYAEPIFVEQSISKDFVPAETTHSGSSEEYYQQTIGNAASSLGQSSFVALLSDGITDDILKQRNKKIWLRFFQDKYKSAHILTLGLLGVSRTFPVNNRPSVSCTITPEFPSEDRDN
ncbi:MAG: hypothetical protein PHT48_09550 [Dechloromonas sp.]|nr:hypothetical protein [Dechloromonas sp.]